MDDEIWLTACPECGATADVVPEGCVESTNGPLQLVRVRCVERHWFLMAAASLPRAVEQPRAPQTHRS